MSAAHTVEPHLVTPPAVVPAARTQVLAVQHRIDCLHAVRLRVLNAPQNCSGHGSAVSPIFQRQQRGVLLM